MSWSRRKVLLLAGGAAAGAGFGAPAWAQAPAVDTVGRRLRPWRPGELDIHHIATGRGESTLVIGPDGSSLMIDAGASAGASPPALSVRPDASRRAGQWIGRYAQRRLDETGGREIDVFLATHQDPDHIGDVDPDAPLAPGGYRLTGVSDVDAVVPIRRLVDRGFPDYDTPARSTAPFRLNYEAFVRARLAQGRSVERFRAGALDQLRRGGEAALFPEFSIRNIAVNGEVWTGEGEAVRPLFPSLTALPSEDRPEENVWSAALRLSYGDFDYFIGGDLTSSTFDGALPWRDVGTAAAKAAGPVEVAVTPHHGMFDGVSAEMGRALTPRIWVVPAWHAVHPSLSILERLFSPHLYPGPREVFATGLDPSTAAAAPWLMDRLSSRDGHVIVRVSPGGRTYHIVVTDNADEGDRVTATFGPFEAVPPLSDELGPLRQ
ncbi:ComEC/Rec2 family competence protein [Brevundimonas diminuta]|uniref:ComEC/Rec2 family competence protein n=1 Tax=Brevundimonas diminuta TaxID=293 RepID=UPI003CFCC3AB